MRPPTRGHKYTLCYKLRASWVVNSLHKPTDSLKYLRLRRTHKKFSIINNLNGTPETS